MILFGGGLFVAERERIDLVLADVVWRPLGLPVLDKGGELLIGDPRALHADGAPLVVGQVEHVALAEERLGASGVEDDAAVGLACHREGDTARDVRLDQTGDDVHARPLRCDDEMNADGASLGGEATDRGFDVVWRKHHQVGKLVDHQDDVWQRLCVGIDVANLFRRVRRRGVFGRCLQRPVVRVEMAVARLRKERVASLHLLADPKQQFARLGQVGHDGVAQVGDALVLGQFDLLRVDHEEVEFVWPAVAQQRRDDRVEADRFAGARLARNQDMRHAGEVADARAAVDISAEADAQAPLVLDELARFKNLA